LLEQSIGGDLRRNREVDRIGGAVGKVNNPEIIFFNIFNALFLL
jgi:hypothetical protein